MIQDKVSALVHEMVDLLIRMRAMPRPSEQTYTTLERMILAFLGELEEQKTNDNDHA